jgi:hypothetical protein
MQIDTKQVGQRPAEPQTVIKAQPGGPFVLTSQIVPTYILQFMDRNQGFMFGIRLDNGRIDFREGITPDEASRRFWDNIEGFVADAIKRHRPMA